MAGDGSESARPHTEYAPKTRPDSLRRLPSFALFPICCFVGHSSGSLLSVRHSRSTVVALSDIELSANTILSGIYRHPNFRLSGPTETDPTEKIPPSGVGSPRGAAAWPQARRQVQNGLANCGCRCGNTPTGRRTCPRLPIRPFCTPASFNVRQWAWQTVNLRQSRSWGRKRPVVASLRSLPPSEMSDRLSDI